ncbi:glycoside hydrolase family protein [Halosimplex halophilum]|uniref:hypothetical protein n=1 Tax=Halosimplex halophilum TaxID=2559572 RepID=UPI00107F12CB|nr:hypothetical protein [Halosimplex halophilum]
MQTERGALIDFVKYGVIVGIVLGLVGGATTLFLFGGSQDPADRRACVQPPDEFAWNSTQPESATPKQTLSGSGEVVTEQNSTYQIEYRAERTRNSSVFAGVSHDNQLEWHDGKLYLLGQYHCTHLYKSDSDTVPMTADGWEINRTDVFYRVKPPGDSVDNMLRANGSWYAYYSRSVLTGDSLNGNWSWYKSLPEGIDDTGVYHENGTFHMFYEAGNTSGLSGSKIGYATSPNGISDWTIREPVYRSEDGFKTGDYEIVKHDGMYLVFADRSKEHPKYDVALFATAELGTNLTYIGNVAAPFRNSSVQPEKGIQDPTVAYDETREKFVLYAHAHEERRRLHAATVDISISRSSVGTINQTAS